MEKGENYMFEFYVGYIIGIIIWGCIWGVATNKVIENKGYYENWFWWGFWFGFIGFLVAMSKPERKSEMVYSHLTSIANERVPTGGWKCKKCGAGNYSYVGTCGCGNPKIASIDNTSYKVNVSSNIPKPMIQEKKAEKIVVSAADEILKFKKLCDDGIITTEEFEKKKTQLLNL